MISPCKFCGKEINFEEWCNHQPTIDPWHDWSFEWQVQHLSPEVKDWLNGLAVEFGYKLEKDIKKLDK